MAPVASLRARYSPAEAMLKFACRGEPAVRRFLLLAKTTR
jgi:hypothetical protein